VSWSDVRLEWLPYTLEIPEFLGTVEGRNAHQRRCIRYSYMDARGLTNRRGLTVRGPQKIFDSSIAAIGMLYAQRHDFFRKYYDLVFERFWKRALDIEMAKRFERRSRRPSCPQRGESGDSTKQTHLTTRCAGARVVPVATARVSAASLLPNASCPRPAWFPSGEIGSREPRRLCERQCGSAIESRQSRR